MKSSSNAVLRFLTNATPEQKQIVAKAAGTSVAYLRHVAYGRRKLSADKAQRLAHASRELGTLALRLNQRELCADCRRCTIAR